jgi:hypothetical protein
MEDTTIDGGLEDIRLSRPALNGSLAGVEYVLELGNVERVILDDIGTFDIFEVEVIEANGDGATPVGGEAKISIQRDLKGWKKEKKDKLLVSLLVAINGGDDIVGRSDFLTSVKDGKAKGTKFRAKVGRVATKGVDPKTGKNWERHEYAFSPYIAA